MGVYRDCYIVRDLASRISLAATRIENCAQRIVGSEREVIENAFEQLRTITRALEDVASCAYERDRHVHQEEI